MQSQPNLTPVVDRQPEPARLLLLEPNEVARLGVHRMLECAAPEAEVDSTNSWWHATPLTHQSVPDVLLISSDLEGQPNDELVARLRRAGTKIVLIVRSADAECLRGLLRLPVSAVLRQVDLSIQSLTQVLGALEQEFVAMPRAAAQQLLGLEARHGGGLPPGAPALTPRELDTLGLMVEGLSNRQIAREMGISEHGSKRHVANVMAKLNCHNRTMAVTTAIRLGLVNTEQ